MAQIMFLFEGYTSHDQKVNSCFSLCSLCLCVSLLVFYLPFVSLRDAFSLLTAFHWLLLQTSNVVPSTFTTNSNRVSLAVS